MSKAKSSLSIVEVRGLTKRFGEIRAVDGLSFEVQEGEIYGLLGPNGAGKTTTFSMLSGVLAPDGGSIHIDGLDLAAEPIAAKSRLGVVPQETAVYEELNAKENLRFWGGLYGLAGSRLETAISDSLARVGLAGRAKEPVKNFSGGMKRRLNLALGLVHGPRLVLLDEPTVGIDPQARLNILEVVRDVAAHGSTVIYTTHYLEEAESLCDRIAILDHGQMLAEGSLEELKSLVGEEEIVRISGRFDAPQLSELLTESAGAKPLSIEDGRLLLSVGNGQSASLLSTVYGSGAEVQSVSIQPPSLDNLFLKLTGRELRD